jgi:hypothetical protein
LYVFLDDSTRSEEGTESDVFEQGGAKMAEATLNNLGWRWGIGMWCILVSPAPLLP